MSNCKLTEKNKDFIRKNYLTMSAEELADRINCATKYAVVDFKRRENLKKLNYTRKPKGKVLRMKQNRFFNVHAMENWVA